MSTEKIPIELLLSIVEKMDGLLYKFALKYTDIADGIVGRGIYASFGFSVLLHFSFIFYFFYKAQIVVHLPEM